MKIKTTLPASFYTFETDKNVIGLINPITQKVIGYLTCRDWWVLKKYYVEYICQHPAFKESYVRGVSAGCLEQVIRDEKINLL